MELNTIKPAAGSKHARRRVGRGIGSGLGKTAGRGHKGQKSRSGGYHKVGFEGGQMPLQRRLPKRGFKSHLLKFNAEVTLTALEKLGLPEVDLLTLKQAGLVGELAKVVKVVKTGALTKAVKLTGIGATAGAKAAIEASTIISDETWKLVIPLSEFTIATFGPLANAVAKSCLMASSSGIPAILLYKSCKPLFG